MYKVYHKVAIIFLSLFIFTSCKNLFEDSVDETEEIRIEQTGTTSSTPASSAPAQKAKITFGGSLKVEGALPSKVQKILENPNDTENDPLETDASRSARPTIGSGSNYQYYVRAYTNDNVDDVIVIPVENATTHQYEYSLELELEHTWKFEAGFKRLASGTPGEADYQAERKLLIDYDSKINNPFSIDLHSGSEDGYGSSGHVFVLCPYQSTDGKGCINLEINIENNAANSIKLKAYNGNGLLVDWGDAASKVHVVEESGKWYIRSDGVDTSNLDASTFDVKSDTYDLTIMFYKNYTLDSNHDIDLPVFTSYQTINVFDNLTTDTWLNENATISGSSQVINRASDTDPFTFKLTTALVTEAAQTTYYVGLPDIVKSQVTDPETYLAANDNYTGAPYAPFATLTRAFNKIQAQGSSGKNYTIYVSGNQNGNFTIPAALTTDNATSIELKTPESNSSVAVLNGGKNGTVLNVASSVPVKISRLQITGGNAENGGGIYIDSDAKVTLGNGAVLGKSGVNSAASSASACGNYASTAGAGIYCKGQLTLKSGSLISYNYVADSDADQQGGGGIYCEGGTITFESGAKVSYNGAHTQGGGICLYSGTVNMTAGEISNNAGNAVCIRGDLPDGTTYAFNLGGSAKIPYGVSGVTGEGKNDICLSSNKYISLQSNLSQHDHDNNPLAIKTSQFKRGTQVLSLANADLINSNGNKFIINDDSEWKVVNTNNSDELTKGFIDTEFIYVGSSKKVSGSGIEAPDSSDKRGTKAKPYATIKEAVNQCWSTQRDFTIKISGQIGNTSSAEEIPAAFSSAYYKQGLAASITIEGANGDNTKDIINRGRTQQTKTNKGSALIIENTAPITLKNLKITGGATTEFGGGIFMGDFKLLTVTLGEGVLVEGNYAAKDGGGIHVKGNYDNPSKLIMTSNARVCNNTAGRQGGGVDLVNANLYMSGNAIIGQKVSGTELSDTAANSEENSSNFSGDVSYGGGGVSCDQYVNVYLGYASDGTTTTGYELADDAGILYNYAIGKGGGVYLSGKKAYLFVSSGSISNNASYHEGGGVYLNSTESTDPLTMNGGYISKNNGRKGGGIYANNGTLKITNGSMSANTATDNGGAVYISSNGAFKIQGDANLYTNTNTLKTNDVYLESGKTIEITNNLNKDNVATLTPGVSTWSRGSTQILSGSEYIETNKNKFKISDPDWKVESKTSDSTTIGVIDADIWVASTEDGETTTRSPGVGKGSNDNRGTKSQPYATLSKAVAACWDTSKTKDFTIYIDGTVTGSQQIGNSASSSSAGAINAKQLTLQGYIPEGTTSSTATLDGNSGTSTSIRTLVINASRNASNGESIIIKNLKITGGNNTTSGGQGGGIYLKNGIVHLADGAVVAGNKAYYGGGVYTNSGTKLYIHGKAMIGDTLEYTAKSENLVVGGTSYPGNSNYASFNGGGIYNDGSLYIGMSTDTGGDYLDSGYGIFRNYAATNGGGIYNNGYFKSRGDISYNGCGEEGGAVFLNANATFACGTLKANKSSVNGGALSVNSAKTATLQGDTSKPLTLTENYIEKSVASGANESTVSGGAVYNQGTLEITGPAKMKDNYIKVDCSSSGATVNAKGGAIYNGGTVNITSATTTEITGNYVEVVGESNGGHAYADGGAVYQAGTFNISNKANLYDANASEKHNDVYLASGETLTVAGTLSEDHVAIITPYTWSRGRQYLGVGGTVTSLPAGVEGKFSFAQDGWDSKLYKINNDNDAAKIDADIYVAGTSGVVKCKNSSGTAYAPSNNTIGNWSHPLQSISQALALLDADHNTIVVDGKVTGAQEISGTITPNDIIITGYVPSGETESAATLYGGSSSTLTVIASGKTVTIKNLTITNGNATTGSGAALNGGGIYMSEGTVKLSDGAKIYGNSATNNGGGVYVGSGTALYMHGKALIGFDTTTNKRPTASTLGTTEGKAANKAKYGGGIYNDGGSVYIGCNSSGQTSTGSGSSLVNFALDTGYGIRQNISDNGSTSGNQKGGGIYHASGTLIIASGTVSYNSSRGSAGGAIYCADNATIKGGTITGNYGQSAGAIYIATGKQLEINGNAVITKNTAVTAGGAIYNYGTLKMSAGTIGGTDADNSAGTAGGAIYCWEGSTFEMSGSAYIPYSGTKRYNDVTLQTDCKVKVTSNISLPSGVSTAATLDRVAAGKGKVIVSGGSETLLSNNVGKFATNNPGFKIGTDGALKLKYTPNTLYVKQVDGSKDTSTKTVIYDSEWNSDDLSYNDSETFPDKKFKNIKTALQFITYQETKQDYTIIIDGEVKGQTKIEDDSTHLVTLDADTNCKSITLQGTSYAQNINSHKLNGDFGNTAVADGSTLVINTAIPVTISQLDIIGGNTTGNGGGIRIDKPGESTVAHVTIKKTNIHDNTSTITSDIYCGGGGISNDHGILVLDEKTIIYGNTAAKYGGGVFNKGGKVYMCGGSNGAWIGKKDDSIKVRAQSSNTNANRAGINTESVPGNGGGLYSYATAGGCVYIGYKPPATEGGDPVADTNFNGGFKFNYASNDGGGVYCETGYSGQAFKMYTGYIKQNSADKCGGGVYGTLTMEGGYIEDNYAGEYGGGIYASGDLILNGGTIGSSVSNAAESSNPNSSRGAATNPKKHSNYAGKGGGGIRMTNGSVSSSVTVAYNYAGETGGGVYMSNTSFTDMSYSATTKYNGAGQKGGGIYHSSGGHVTSLSCLMITNKAYNTSGENGGGAIYIATTDTKVELTSTFRITTADSTTVTKGTDDVYVYLTGGYNSPGSTSPTGSGTYIQIPAANSTHTGSKKIGLTINSAYNDQGRLVFIGDGKQYGQTIFKMTDNGRSIGTNGMVY